MAAPPPPPAATAESASPIATNAPVAEPAPKEEPPHEKPARLVNNGAPPQSGPLPRGALRRIGAVRRRMPGFALSQDGLILVGRPQGEPAGAFDTRTHQRLFTLGVRRGNPATDLEAFSISPDRRFVAVLSQVAHGGAYRSTLRLFDGKTGASRTSVPDEGRLRLGPFFSADGSHVGLLMYGEATPTELLLIDLRTMRRRTVPLPEDGYSASHTLAISPGAREFVIAYHGRPAEIVETVSGTDGKLRARWSANRGDVKELFYSPDGRRIAGSGAAGYVWDASSGAPTIEDDKTDGILFGPDDIVYFASSRGVVARAKDGKIVQRHEACGAQLGIASGVLTAAAESADRPFLCAWSTTTAEPLVFSAAAPFGACSWPISFLPSGDEVAAWCAPHLEVWDVSRGLLRELRASPRGLAEIKGGASPDADAWYRIGARYANARHLPSVLPSPDGKRLAVPAPEAILLVDVASEKPIATIATACLSVWAFSADSRLLAVGDCGPIGVHDTATGQRLTTLVHPGLQGTPGYLMFTPDGKHIVARDTNSPEARVFRVADGSLAASSKQADGGNIWSTDLSPNGALLAVGYSEGQSRVFEVPSLKLRSQLSGHEGLVDGVAFSPDGRRLVTAGEEGTMLLWDVARLP